MNNFYGHHTALGTTTQGRPATGTRLKSNLHDQVVNDFGVWQTLCIYSAKLDDEDLHREQSVGWQKAQSCRFQWDEHRGTYKSANIAHQSSS